MTRLTRRQACAIDARERRRYRGRFYRWAAAFHSRGYPA